MAEVEPNNSHQNKEISNNKKKHLPKYAQFLLTGIAGAAIGAGLTFGIMEVKELSHLFIKLKKCMSNYKVHIIKKSHRKHCARGQLTGCLIVLTILFLRD